MERRGSGLFSGEGYLDRAAKALRSKANARDSLSFAQWRYFSLSKHPVPAWEMPPNREVDKGLLHGAQHPHQGRDGEGGDQWEVEFWDLSLLIYQVG